jgi:adenylate cyclase
VADQPSLELRRPLVPRSEANSGLLDAFYDECTSAIWECDGLLNKTIGDAVMAVFNFPIRHEDHTRQAVFAARAIQRRWSARRETLASSRPRSTT